MKLQQLRYAVEVLRRNLNVSEAADSLFTSQPGVSKQIRLLEEELGVQIFIRSGKRIVSVTPAGSQVLATAERILRDAQSIRNIGSEFAQTNHGTLTIAATHSVLRFKLPETVIAFQTAFPDVKFTFKQGSPNQIAAWVHDGEADFAVGRDTPEHLSDLKKLPCGNWRYVIAMPHEHELAKIPEITLALLAKYPLLTYNFTFSGTTVATRAFQRSGVSAYNVAFESDDAAILLQYAQLGLGVALLDDAACANYSGDLMIRDVGHLFEPSQFQILLRSDAVIRSYIYDFIERLNGNLTRETVDKLLYAPAMVDFSI